MTKPNRKICVKCGNDKPIRQFYASHSPMHKADKRMPYCKVCLSDMVDPDNLKESIQEILRQIDRPFLQDIWDSSVNEISNTKASMFGTYMKNIAMVQYRDLTWDDSDEEIMTSVETEEERAQKEIDRFIREEDLTEDDIRELEDKWGYGFEPQELIYFQRKYDNLIGNYPQSTSLHREALMTYCVYKVRAEVATAEGDIREAKDWAQLAQKQGEIAKINLNKLDKSDLSQGMDSFSELVAMVEKEVDIIPILPKFIERPQDKIDLAIYSFINYERRLHGLPDVEYSDIYDFYQDNLREYMDSNSTNEDVKRHMKEIEIDSKKSENGKKKIIFYDVFAYIDELKLENPDDSFIQDLDKWVEFVSWGRFNIDLFMDMVTPDAGGITLDVDQRFVLRALSRFKSAMCVFPRGYGKCVAGDSLLFTDEGIKEIGEYFNYQDDGVETYTKHDINLVDKHGNIEKSDKGVYSGYKETKIIRTEEGYEVEGTHNHPLLTINKDGELEWRNLEDFNTGDYIAINRNNDIWGNNTKLNIDMDSWINQYNNHEKGGLLRSKCKTPDVLDEDMARVLGYLIGDGCLTRDNIVIFSNKDDDILNNFMRIIEDKLGIKDIKRSGETHDYTIYGRYVREYFRQVGLDQLGSHDKVIPKCIMTAPKNIVRSFLIGLYDTDGTINRVTASHTTASEKMSKQVQLLLLNFGIVSTRRRNFNKQFKTFSYTTSVHGANIDLFYDKIGFGCSRKQALLKKYTKVTRNTNKDIIPMQKDKLSNLFGVARELGLHDAVLYDRFYHARVGNNELTYNRLNVLIDKYSENDIEGLNHFADLKSRGYFFSRVDTIQDSENHVYDLQVPESQSFIANGIVNHNTFTNLLYNFHTSIFYPNMEIALTAQTQENASALVGEKWREIIRFYPIFEEEMRGNPSFSKHGAEIMFKSSSRLDTLVNGQSAKGARRRRITVEEYAQVDNDVFVDVIAPIPNIPRVTVGRRGTINPYELNGQINYFTTSWFVG